MQDSNHTIERPIRPPPNLGSLNSNQPDSEHGAHTLQLSLHHESQFLKLLRVLIIFGFVVIVLLVSYVCYLDKELDQLKSATALQSQQSKVNYESFNEKIANLFTTSRNLEQDLLKNSLQSYKGLNQIGNLYFKTKKDKQFILTSLSQFYNNFQSVKNRYVSELMAMKNSVRKSPLLPKIIWIYTEFNFNSEKMVQQLLGNFIVQKARQSGFEIRFVNAWTAYDFLSYKTTQKITKTMQNRKFEESVNELLRLALLKQHGGVILKVPECLMVGNFDFLSNYFKMQQFQNDNFFNEVLLFGQYSQTNPLLAYQDYFIAAAKKSMLITETFQTLCEIISTGDMKYKNIKSAALIRQDVQSTYVPYITQKIIQSLVDIYTPAFYSLHAIPVDITKFITPICRENLAYFLKRPDWQYISACGKPVHIIHLSNHIDRPRIQEELQHQLITQKLNADQYGYWHAWMVIKENRKLFDPLPQRAISFCLIDAHSDNDYESIVVAFEKLKYQIQKNYTAVYFVYEISPELYKYQKNQQYKGFNLILVKDTGSVGRNYEVGIIKHCPSKSFVFILKRNQFLKDPEALKILANVVKPRGVLGAYIGLNYNGNNIFTKQTYTNYNKLQYNGRSPRIDDLESIVNHLRVFHSDCYKIIPQFNLRTHTGTYFNDRLNFLEHFLYMVQNLTDKHDDTQIPHKQRVKWFIKSNSHIFDVPNRIVTIHNVVITTSKWDNIDLQELKMNYFKAQPYAMSFNMDHLVQNGIHMEQFAVFNPALQYQPYTKRNKPQIIPRVFHLVWIDGEMPESKKKVLQLNQQKYPDFQFKIWSKHNITRQRFPLSYDLLNTIYDMQQTSRYSKRATMADVFRHQLLYNEGGIYMDTSMLLFNSQLSKWLSYKFFLATQRTYRHRWAQSMCIFGVMPKFEGLKRVITQRNTNHYNIYLRDALEIAGPHDFRWTVRGIQQYDPDYLIMDYDTFYPMSYDLPKYYQSYCFIQQMYLRANEQIFYKHKNNNRVMPRQCGKYYPFSFGKQINNIGSSWQSPKW